MVRPISKQINAGRVLKNKDLNKPSASNENKIVKKSAVPKIQKADKNKKATKSNIPKAQKGVENNITKESSIPKEQKTPESSIQKFVSSSPKQLKKSQQSLHNKSNDTLSPIKEKFIETIRKELVTRKPVSSLDKRVEEQKNLSKTEKSLSKENVNNKSRRKSLPRKLIVQNEFGTVYTVPTTIWKEIRSLQKQTHNLIPIAPFLRLVREILINYGGPEMRIQRLAINALQESCETYMTQFFQDCYLCTLHANRATLMIKDMQLARRLRGSNDVVNH